MTNIFMLFLDNTINFKIAFSAGTASVAAYTKHHKNATGVSRYEIKWKETDDVSCVPALQIHIQTS